MKLLLKRAKEIIEDIEYLNIASVTKDGLPWNSPVYCSYDKDISFYWMSWKENQHSKNIRGNQNVFCTIYDSTCPAGTGFGVYFQGRAYELSNPREVFIGIKSIYGRSQHKMAAAALFLKKFPRRVYTFVPDKIWVNGDDKIDGHFIDMRTELNLEDLKLLFR
ncbi:pyridoxamine 5'-phosphate oxidase family protein [Candidatus Uhrbacteria bacterium]|nr:pyridoxamine 5'-phosphate oxidase family protein [Candidatus Uhrbacteria bacterium]